MDALGLFYEDEYDAVNKAIIASGKTRKELALKLYPNSKPETAQARFTRLLAENSDEKISVQDLLYLMRETRPEDFVYFLCDEFGFERPERKSKEAMASSIKKQLTILVEGVNHLSREIKRLEGK